MNRAMCPALCHAQVHRSCIQPRDQQSHHSTRNVAPAMPFDAAWVAALASTFAFSNKTPPRNLAHNHAGSNSYCTHTHAHLTHTRTHTSHIDSRLSHTRLFSPVCDRSRFGDKGEWYDAAIVKLDDPKTPGGPKMAHVHFFGWVGLLLTPKTCMHAHSHALHNHSSCVQDMPIHTLCTITLCVLT